MKKNSIVLILFLLVFSRLFSQNTTVAVIDFDGRGVSQDEVKTLTDRFRDELIKTQQFTVLERGKMEEIFEVFDFNLSGCTSEECVVEAGKLLAVQQIWGGSIGKVGNVITVSARVIDVETGKILMATNYDYRGEIGGLLTQGMKTTVLQLISGGKSKSLSVSGTGSIYVASDPSGAAVWIDDTPVDGITPLVIDGIALGTHKIYAEKDDYSAETSAQIETDDIVRINLVLNKGKGKLKVISTPFEAQVMIDGEYIGQSPILVKDLKTGRHELTLSKDGYFTLNKSIEIRNNQTVEFEASLIEKPQLTVKSTPSNVAVFIDDLAVGKTPLTFRTDPGNHTVVLRKEGYKNKEINIELSTGEKKELQIDLHQLTGSLVIESIPSSADVLLDGVSIGRTLLRLPEINTGKHSVEIRKPDYFPVRRSIIVQADRLNRIEVQLESRANIHVEIEKLRAKRNFWYGTAFLSALAGGYFMISADKHYKDYQTAVNDATMLHKTITEEDRIATAAFGFGGFSLVRALLLQHNRSKLRKRLDLSIIPVDDSYRLALVVEW